MITDHATEAERAEAWTRLMKSTKSNNDALMDAYEWLIEAIELRERGEVTLEQRVANGAIMDDVPNTHIIGKAGETKAETAANAQKFIENAHAHVREALRFEHKRANPDLCKNCGYDYGEHDEMNRCPNDDGDAYLNRQNRYG